MLKMFNLSLQKKVEREDPNISAAYEKFGITDAHFRRATDPQRSDVRQQVCDLVALDRVITYEEVDRMRLTKLKLDYNLLYNRLNGLLFTIKHQRDPQEDLIKMREAGY